jgi:hypothetical protein
MNPPDQPTIAPTPRTDAAKEQYLTGKIGIYGVLDEARTLERGLAAAKAECEREKARSAYIASEWDKDEIETNAELARLRADLERFTGHGLLDCHAICDQRDAAVAERDQLRAEVERLNDIIIRAGVQFFHDGTDGQTAEKMLTVLNETKLLKNKTTTP